jgi:hypothetical protein
MVPAPRNIARNSEIFAATRDANKKDGSVTNQNIENNGD